MSGPANSGPFHLTLAALKAAALKAHQEGRLTAQAEKASERLCVLKLGHRCCALGAALPPHVLDAANVLDANLSVGIHVLLVNKIVSVDREHEVQKIQSAHDDWCEANDEKRDDAETFFLSLIKA